MVLVTGGSGLLGSHLLFFLLKKGENVRAIHRKSSDLMAVKKVFRYYSEAAEAYFDKIEWVEADVNDIPALNSAFENVKKVYHAAAYISFNPKNFHKLKKANIEGTANIVNLSISHGVQKLCHVSSIATFGKSANGGLISEETHWNPEADNSVYAITKYGAEMEVWRGTQEGLQAVIVNPAVILGEGHWNASSGTIVKMVAKGTKFYTPGGVAVVDVCDVVKSMIALMDSSVANQQFILAAENLYYKELLGRLALHLNVAPPTKEIARWKLNGLRKLDWLKSMVLGSRRKLLKATVNSLYHVSFFDGSKIEKSIPFNYTPTEETLKRVCDNYPN
jgi:nucleoside-diphosphate-sugar epimerase